MLIHGVKMVSTRQYVSPVPIVGAKLPRRSIFVRASAPGKCDTSLEDSVALLKQAANTKSVPGRQVFAALRALEKASVQDPSWPEIVGGRKSPGNRWQLVFTTGTKQVRDALKGKEGGGNYFPITAAQRWDASTGTIENGIYLGLIAALTFSGPYEYVGKKLSFDFDKLKLKLGPWSFEFGLKDEIKNYEGGKSDPFFVIFYVDEDIICARGRGGGIAFWARTDRDFDLKHLI